MLQIIYLNINEISKNNNKLFVLAFRHVILTLKHKKE